MVTTDDMAWVARNARSMPKVLRDMIFRHEVCYSRDTSLSEAFMLLELRAENYAVIDRAVATFGLGLNLLTGETGAGKSILIDALALLLGGKPSPDVLQHRADKAVVGCVFELTPGAAAILEENGMSSVYDRI